MRKKLVGCGVLFGIDVCQRSKYKIGNGLGGYHSLEADEVAGNISDKKRIKQQVRAFAENGLDVGHVFRK